MTAKAKRKLSDIDFQHDGAHVALTHKSQGYSANGKPFALIMKAKSKEFVEKIQQVKVTMDVPEFLERFFYMWGEDKAVLAALLGYEDPEKGEYPEYDDYIQSKVDAIEILKSLNKSDNVSIALAGLPETDILTVLKSQEKLEPILEQYEKSKVTEKTMPNKEMVEKSVLDQLQTNFDEQKVALEKAASDLEAVKVELNKANETIKSYQDKEAAAKQEARKAALKDAVADDTKVELLMKSFALISDDDFKSTVETLKSLRTAQEKSELFKESGASTDEQNSVKESLVQKALKAELAKHAK